MKMLFHEQLFTQGQSFRECIKDGKQRSMCIAAQDQRWVSPVNPWTFPCSPGEQAVTLGETGLNPLRVSAV